MVVGRQAAGKRDREPRHEMADKRDPESSVADERIGAIA